MNEQESELKDGQKSKAPTLKTQNQKTKQLFLVPFSSRNNCIHSKPPPMIPPLVPFVQEPPRAERRASVKVLEVVSSAALLSYAELRLVARRRSARAASRNVRRAV